MEMNEKQTAVDLETVNCPVCNAREGKRLFESYDKLWGHPGTYPAVSCGDCGMVYLSPRPSADAKQHLYQDYGFKPGEVAQPLDHYLPVIRALTDAKPQGGRLLDVGTGNGPFLPEMQSRGWEVEGTEVDERFAAYFQQEFSIEVFTGDLADAGYPDSKFDAVTIMGVIEHLHDPRGALLEINRILDQDGILGVWCFNRGLEARILGKYWLGFDTPRHLHSFSVSTMTRLLNDTGFEPFATFYRSHTHMATMTAWMLKRMRNAFSGTRQPVHTIGVPRSLNRLCHPLGKFLSATKATSDVYLFCRKTAR